MNIKAGWTILKGTIQEFGEDKVLRLSAAMAYYTVFSIGPLLVLMVGLAGLVLGQETVREQVLGQLRGMLGERSTGMVESMMNSRRASGSIMATVIGGAGLLFGAAGVFGQLQDSLNTIWEVKPKEGRGIWGFIRDRFLSFTMVLGVGFLLLVSMVLTTLLGAFSGYLSNLISVPEWILGAFHFLLSFGVITTLFALIFKVLPDVQIRWGDVWIGAVGTTLLFVAGKFALGWYLGREGVTSAYGAGSSFVLILLYIYYSAVILFFGAELTQVQAKFRGAHLRPGKYAEPVTEENRVQQGITRETGSGHQGSPARPRHPQPAAAYAVGGAFEKPESAEVLVEENMSKHTEIGRGRVTHHPLQSIRQQPWSFLTLALATGVAAGLFMKMGMLRRGWRLYSTVRRFI
jgi:membrane protein